MFCYRCYRCLVLFLVRLHSVCCSTKLLNNFMCLSVPKSLYTGVSTFGLRSKCGPHSQNRMSLQGIWVVKGILFAVLAASKWFLIFWKLWAFNACNKKNVGFFLSQECLKRKMCLRKEYQGVHLAQAISVIIRVSPLVHRVEKSCTKVALVPLLATMHSFSATSLAEWGD